MPIVPKRFKKLKEKGKVRNILDFGLIQSIGETPLFLRPGRQVIDFIINISTSDNLVSVLLVHQKMMKQKNGY